MSRQRSYLLCIWRTFSFLVVFFFADSMIDRSSSQRSAYFQAFEGHMLDNHVIGIYHVTSALECGTRCLRNPRCLSFNYKSINNDDHECQLNDANILICPECYHAEHDVTYYDDAKVNSCIGKDGERSNYDLYFPLKGLTSYINQTWSMDIQMFTICFWMQTNDSDIGAPFSYATSGATNEITIFKTDLTVNNDDSDIDLGNYYDGLRHHVCARWENQAGSWDVTVDGTIITNGTGKEVGHTIPGGGYLIIGQEQDNSPGDPSGFSLSQSFVGIITGMNVWSKALTHDEISRMSKSCNMGNGDVLKWADFQIWRHGDVQVRCPSLCKV